MNRPATTPLNSAPADEDLAEQAHPNHGIPSQDPEAAAQFPLEPVEAQREAKSVLIGGGLVAGAATGATVGVVVAGPVGVVVGGAVGAVVGALGAAAAGATAKHDDLQGNDTSPANTAPLPGADRADSGPATVAMPISRTPPG